MRHNVAPPSLRVRAIWIAVALLSIDVVFIAADLLRHSGVLHDVRFAVTTERGFGEWFQYAKTLSIVVLLFSARRRTDAAVVWAGLFAYLLMDDAFAVHEAVGRAAASAFSLPGIGSVRPAQVGELMTYSVVALAFTVALTAVLRRGNAASWSLSVALAPPFAVLVFFGGIVDLLHSLLRSRSHRYAAGVIEDGGELLAMSVIVAIAYWATRE